MFFGFYQPPPFLLPSSHLLVSRKTPLSILIHFNTPFSHNRLVNQMEREGRRGREEGGGREKKGEGGKERENRKRGRGPCIGPRFGSQKAVGFCQNHPPSTSPFPQQRLLPPLSFKMMPKNHRYYT